MTGVKGTRAQAELANGGWDASWPHMRACAKLEHGSASILLGWSHQPPTSLEAR